MNLVTSEAKLETKNIENTCVVSKNAIAEHSSNRPSRRLESQNLRVDTIDPIENGATSSSCVEDSSPRVTTNRLDNGVKCLLAADNFCSNVKNIRSTCFKNHGCPRNSNQRGSCAKSQLRKSLNSQVSKEFDEFLVKNFKLSCCLCHASLTDFFALKKHFRAKHHVRGYVMCCGKKLLKRGILVDHIRTHMDPEFFKCVKCNKVAANRRCLELHLKMHEQKSERNFECDICSKSFVRRSVFMRHLLLHIPDEEKKVNCPQCEKVFATENTMNQHLKLVHLNMYVKICDVCGKSIRGREAFHQHQLEHSGFPKPLVHCKLCGIKLTNKYGLTKHMKVIHSEENLRPQVCNICSKVSPTMSAHQRHMNYMHSLERKHACPMCEKAYKRATELKEHMTTHTGEILYTCPHCPKTFNSNANMHSHRKKAHRQEWEEKRMQRYHNPNDGMSSKSITIQMTECLAPVSKSK